MQYFRSFLAALALAVGFVAALINTNASAQVTFTPAQRLAPNGNFTMYVAPASGCAAAYWGAGGPQATVCGIDTVGCGFSQSMPCATPQYVNNALFANYDFQGLFCPTMQLAVAYQQGQPNAAAPYQMLYSGLQVSGRLVGQPGTLAPLFVGPGKPSYPVGVYCPYTIQGDPAYPKGATLNPGAGGRASIPALSLTDSAAMKLSGIGFDTSTTPMDCLDIYSAFAEVDNLYFGNCGPPPSSYNLSIGIAWVGRGGATLIVNGPLTVAGSAFSFIQAGASSSVLWNNNDAFGMLVTWLNSPHFPQGIFVADGSQIFMAGVQQSGVATGPAALVLRLGTMFTATGTPSNTHNSCAQSAFPNGSSAPVVYDGSCW